MPGYAWCGLPMCTLPLRMEQIRAGSMPSGPTQAYAGELYHKAGIQLRNTRFGCVITGRYPQWAVEAVDEGWRKN